MTKKSRITADRVIVYPDLGSESDRRHGTGEHLLTMMPGRAIYRLTQSMILIVALVAIGLIAGCGPNPTETPTEQPMETPTEEPTATSGTGFTYELQVQDLETREVIPNASVTVEMVDVPIDNVLTNLEGKATISIGSLGTDQVVKLIVHVDGYEDDVQYIDLSQDTLPPVVFLERKPPTPSISTVPSSESPSPPPTATDVPAATSTLSSTPTNTPSPSPLPRPTSTPTLMPTPSIPLSIRDIWPVETECRPGGAWSADIWVRPVGGDGTYTYYVDGDWKAGPTTEGVTIRIDNINCTAIVGTVTVESGGQIESREFFVSGPDCCGN